MSHENSLNNSENQSVFEDDLIPYKIKVTKK